MYEQVELEMTGQGVPSGLRRSDGTEYVVIDKPTPFEFDLCFVTHPPPPRVGWRFSGRSSADEVRVFDVLRSAGSTSWMLIHAYD